MLLRYKKSANLFSSEAEPQQILTPLFKDNIRYWIFVYPVMVLPSPLAAGWVFACRILSRIDKAAGFPMLNSRDGSG
jgi:hypothetical protein